jgi:aminopeptidase
MADGAAETAPGPGFVERLAGVLVDYSTRIREGDLVSIDTTPAAAPLVHELWRRVLAKGGNPHLRLDVEGAPELMLRDGSEEQLSWVSPVRRAEVERADVRIAIEADVNTRANSLVDPERQAHAERAREPLRRVLFERMNAGELRYVVTLYPTQAAAQDADMSLPEYEEFVFNAGLLDRDDPVVDWEALGRAYENPGRPTRPDERDTGRRRGHGPHAGR